MRSLTLLYEDPGINENQRKFFCRVVVGGLSVELSLREIALGALRLLWERYDSGGHSHGRSLRSALLEEIISCLDQERDEEKMRTCFSVLLGMYHDAQFINSAKWYDYEIGHFVESDMFHRAWLATAAFCIELDDVADMDDWPIEKIRHVLKN